jgi:hypothetical protein
MTVHLPLPALIAALAALRIRSVEAEAMGLSNKRWRDAFEQLQAAVYLAIADEIAAGEPKLAADVTLQH